MDPAIYPFEFLYDGDCAICRADVVRLRRRDHAGLLRFVDISAPDFDGARYGRDRSVLLARIHGRRADGRMVEGVEVFRIALAATGPAWLAVPLGWPLLAALAEVGYRLFARHRVMLSRRFGGVFERLTPACTDDTCALPPRKRGVRP